MATTNITLELRQSDANKVNSNGDYETNLARQITINDGDIVQLKSCFLDTVNDQNITITDDLTLQLVNGVYITDWLYSDTFKEDWVLANGTIPSNTNLVSPSGNNFIPYKVVGSGPSSQFEYIDYAIYTTNNNTAASGNLGVTYEYVDINGNTQFYNSTLYWANRRGTVLPNNPANTIWDPVNIIAKIGTFQAIDPTPAIFDFLNVIPNGYSSSPVVLNETIQPWLFTTNISVPKGSYTPTEIATLISKELSKNTTPANGKMVGSNFLFESSQFDAGAPNPDGTAGTIANQTEFISAKFNPDGTLAEGIRFKFVADKSMFIGSSQMALEFNPDNNKFNFTYLHTPMYDATNGSAISVRYINKLLDPTQPLLDITTNGGVFFTSLSATDSNGKFVDFWGNILGFDVASICVNTTPRLTNIFGDTTSKYYLLDNLVQGQNVTGGYIGLDTAVVKGSTSWYLGQTPPTAPNAQAGVNSTLSDTVTIESKIPYIQLTDSFSHYLLQLDINFYNTFVGVDNYRTLNAIVNKYYNYGSYTFGDPDSALTYVHKGAPLYLKSIKTRILTPSKQLDKTLGSDNTIYLSVIKPIQTTGGI